MTLGTRPSAWILKMVKLLLEMAKLVRDPGRDQFKRGPTSWERHNTLPAAK